MAGRRFALSPPPPTAAAPASWLSTRCALLVENTHRNIMKTVAALSLLASASAFAPAQTGSRAATSLAAEKSTALPFLPYPENLKGYVGDVGFDPFRFSDFVPMDFLREAELKHGRICMMAWLGFCAVDCGLRVYPLPEAYEGLTSVTAHDALVEYGAMGQLFLWFGLAEVIGTVALMQTLNGSGRAAGDYGLDPVGFLTDKSEEEINDMKLKEIKNGRLAMLAFSGVVTQAVLTQGPFPYV